MYKVIYSPDEHTVSLTEFSTLEEAQNAASDMWTDDPELVIEIQGPDVSQVVK